MNVSHIATAVALRDLGCDSLDTINDRILLQKKVFLAQDAGLPLGYGYSWYIHGPYSPDLTAVAYQIIPEGFDSIEHNSFKERYAKMISRVNALEQEVEHRGLRISTVQWYELVASLAYWYRRNYKSEEEIVTRIRETKPQFTQEQTKAAYNAYIKFINDIT